MPKPYHIEVKPAPPRFAPVPKFSGLEIEGCLGCLVCVKRVSCVYDVYKKRKFDPAQIVDSADIQCLTCMRCVQECKKNILARVRNPAYERLGNDYWKPDIIASIWKQSETGKIPVSGAGYRGRFSGPGFDRIWTDMSEIVRPTRDGIHGREYINTMIDIGNRPARLSFDANGRLLTDVPQLLDLPLPVLLDRPDLNFVTTHTLKAIAEAANRLGTLAFASSSDATGPLKPLQHRLVVLLDPERDNPDTFADAPAVEIQYSANSVRAATAIKKATPQKIVFVRLRLDEHAAARAVALAEGGADVVHLAADTHGNGFGQKAGVFITELVREVHSALVGRCIRDRVTLIVSGGIALAEHVAKIIICGADGVCADLAILAAMECRLCSDCATRQACPVKLNSVPVNWGARRITNLMGAWHAQLIEVLGAMGLREVRRLRGEVGRAMFFEDLERENFAPVFGKRIDSASRKAQPDMETT